MYVPSITCAAVHVPGWLRDPSVAPTLQGCVCGEHSRAPALTHSPARTRSQAKRGFPSRSGSWMRNAWMKSTCHAVGDGWVNVGCPPTVGVTEAPAPRAEARREMQRVEQEGVRRRPARLLRRAELVVAAAPQLRVLLHLRGERRRAGGQERCLLRVRPGGGREAAAGAGRGDSRAPSHPCRTQPWCPRRGPAEHGTGVGECCRRATGRGSSSARRRSGGPARLVALGHVAAAVVPVFAVLVGSVRRLCLLELCDGAKSRGE